MWNFYLLSDKSEPKHFLDYWEFPQLGGNSSRYRDKAKKVKFYKQFPFMAFRTKFAQSCATWIFSNFFTEYTGTPSETQLFVCVWVIWQLCVCVCLGNNQCNHVCVCESLGNNLCNYVCLCESLGNIRCNYVCVFG